MKKNITCLFAFFAVLIAACLFFPSFAGADPPQDITLTYDIKAQRLTVTIKHPVTFTSFHYVKQILIKRNNEPVENWDYTSQPGKTSFTYTYKIRASENDLLEVTATCNIQGRKSAILTVGSGSP